MTSSPNQRRNTGFKSLLSGACLVIVIGGLKLAGAFIIPILLGLFLAVLSLPITQSLQRRRVPGPVAVLCTVVFDLLVLTGLVFMVASIMPDFQASAAKYDVQLREFVMQRVVSLQQWMTETLGPMQIWFAENFGDGTEGEEAPVLFDLKAAAEQVLSVSSLMSVINWNTNILQILISWLTKSFFAFILMIFILAEAERFSGRIEEMIEARGPNLKRFREAGQQMQRYLGIKTLVSVATGLLAWLTCALFGVEFAVVWGLIAFLLNYIPTIGSLVAAIPPVLVALLQLGFWHSFGIGVCYLAINMAIGNFIEPTLLGRGFGISTVVVILSVLFWGWIWGPVGMFLAVPLTMMIKMMVDGSDDFRWLGVAMSKNQDEDLAALIDEPPDEGNEAGEAQSPATPPATAASTKAAAKRPQAASS